MTHVSKSRTTLLEKRKNDDFNHFLLSQRCFQKLFSTGMLVLGTVCKTIKKLSKLNYFCEHVDSNNTAKYACGKLLTL